MPFAEYNMIGGMNYEEVQEDPFPRAFKLVCNVICLKFVLISNPIGMSTNKTTPIWEDGSQLRHLHE